MEIHNDYLDLRHYNNNTETGIKVYWHDYGIERWYGDINHGIIGEPKDISRLIVDYSYDCDYSSDIRQSASITVKVDDDEQGMFGVRREEQLKAWMLSQATLTQNTVQVRKCIYHLIKTYDWADTGEHEEWDLGFFFPVSDSFSYSPTNGTVSISLQGLTCLLTGEQGGQPMMAEVSTVPMIVEYTCKQEDLGNWATKTGYKGYNKQKGSSLYTVYVEERTTTPMTISVDKDISINDSFFFNLALGTWSKRVSILNVSSYVPIDHCECNDGLKIQSMPYQKDYDAESSRMDIIQGILDMAYIEGKVWIDEERVLQVTDKVTERGQIFMYWSQYGELFVSEENSYDWSGYYNITEVYGKDNAYYARCDESSIDGDIAYGIVRKQLLTFDDLQSNEECAKRAKWENWKARNGHQSKTITISDNYIPQLMYCTSNLIGKQIEYTNPDGNTELYVLNKVSTSGTTISLELCRFWHLYEEAKTRTLATPFIESYEKVVKDNETYLRFYVNTENDDIKSGVVKLYGGIFQGYDTALSSTEKWDFYTESVAETSDGRKYVDYMLTQNGKYEFFVELYSPEFETSVWGGDPDAFDEGGTSTGLIIEVTDYEVIEPPEDNYPYPHRNMYTEGETPTTKHRPYLLTETTMVLTTESGDYLAI